MTRRGRWALIFCVCSLTPGAGGAASVVDNTGQQVWLAGIAERIVTLAPHATELTFAAGAGDKVVAVAAFSDHPPRARELPRIGGAGRLDRERLLRLEPDLVVAWHSGNQPSDLRWIERQGIALYRTEPRRLADIGRTLRDLGALAGTSAAAEAAALRWERDLAAGCASGAGAEAVLLLWENPPLSFGGLHWINEVLSRAGLTNAFATTDRAVFAPSPEAVLAARPDYLLTAFAQPAGDRWPGRQVVMSDALTRPSPRLAEALHALCARLEE